MGFPVVVKVLSQQITHKSDLGLVELNICSPDGVKEAYERILKKAREIDPDAAAVVEAMAAQGTETIVGAKRDPQFGPTVLFGLGGIFVEVFKDVAIRVAPVDKAMAMAMIEEVKGYAILKGFRGKKGVDMDALADIIVKTSSSDDEQRRRNGAGHEPGDGLRERRHGRGCQGAVKRLKAGNLLLSR